ncbi:MAG TPA: FtsX-like permease family protein [Pyrinomonadaceae bacterium]|jgi:ABC-type antimicrobial peptide transport system permease subunit
MKFFDILRLALRNLREARLRAALTTLGVIVGVSMIVTMMSFGLGLQRNAVQRFRDLDLFNEITVSGRSLVGLVSSAMGDREDGREGRGRRGGGRSDATDPGRLRSERMLTEAALAEIAALPGVASVEPNIDLTTYVRANKRALLRQVGGALVPNGATRFKSYLAGRMISSPQADEAVVDESFLRSFGFEKAEDAVGQTLELLAPGGAQESEAGARKDKDANAGAGVENKTSAGGAPDEGARGEDEGGLTFFGLPLGEESGGGGGGDDAEGALAVRTFRIVGVLKTEVEGGPQGGRQFRGMMPVSSIYIPLPAARAWADRYRNSISEVAFRLARESGMLKDGEAEGYAMAIVRVTDPDVLPDVQKRLNELGFNSFSIVDQLKELRTVFLILNSALGLLGGISLLVASFGIANTMIMSILERTREIGIMKAIGAEDREIKLIFFVEAGLIGLMGGVMGALAAWAIDAIANRLAYRFVLQPRGVSYVDFFALPPYLWLGAIIFAVAVAILAALYPAARAARIDPVKALRHD